MKKSMCLLMLLALVSFGCKSDNQRTAGNSASPDTSSPSSTSSNSGTAGNQMTQSSTPNSSDEKFITDALASHYRTHQNNKGKK